MAKRGSLAVGQRDMGDKIMAIDGHRSGDVCAPAAQLASARFAGGLVLRCRVRWAGYCAVEKTPRSTATAWSTGTAGGAAAKDIDLHGTPSCRQLHPDQNGTAG